MPPDPAQPGTLATQSAEAALKAALATPAAELEARMRAVRDQVRAPGRTLVLFGAGNLGREILALLRAGGVEPALFADDTAAKQGTRIDGLEVVSPEEAVERLGTGVVFAVTIWVAGARFLDISRRLDATGATVVSSFHLAWAYPEALMPRVFLEHPAHLLEHREEILELAARLADDESRRELLGHVTFRMTLDYAALPRTSTDSYFPPDVIGALPDSISFVDCGAFDGDTLEEFLALQGERFGRVLEMEPDPANRERLEAYVRGLPAPVSERIEVVPAAVGAETGEASFEASGNPSAALAAGGGQTVRVVRLDDVAAELPDPVYVKMDVEGAEPDALRGAERLISERAPRLGVCVYHYAADLWEIPLQIAALRPDYRLYLRTHGEDGADIVCYALPPGA